MREMVKTKKKRTKKKKKKTLKKPGIKTSRKAAARNRVKI